MIDAQLRPLVDRALAKGGSWLHRRAVQPDHVTLAGFVVGVGGAGALGFQAYALALALILLNRLCDGLDGAVARHAGATDFGGFLDIVCDFTVYAALVFGFALGRPDQALAASFLILGFVGSGASFLAFAVIAAKSGVTTQARGRKSFYYVGGLTEGAETIALFIAMCLAPGWFPWLAYGFGTLCWVTALGRTLEARHAFRPPAAKAEPRDD